MSQENNNKKICFTLDLEQDYGRINDYLSFANAPKLIDLFKKYNLKLTVFATGKIIEEKPEIIKLFQNNLDCELQLHSYSHEINRRLSLEEKKKDMEKAITAYKNRFGKNPQGYRAPCGNITQEEIGWLKEKGFLYDSSFIPTYRPGLFNNISAGDKPFFHSNGLLEMPFSAFPYLKIPFSLSYLQLLGLPIAGFFIKKRRGPVIFGFHLHNLAKAKNINQIKPAYRLFYFRNQNNGLKILEKFIKIALKNGYQSVKMSELAKNLYPFAKNLL